MDKELLFRFSCDEKGEPFTLDFHETAEGAVTASYQKRDGGMVFADVEIVDLFGRKTHVPAKVRTLLQIKEALSWEKLAKIEAFKQICRGRLRRSFACGNRFKL